MRLDRPTRILCLAIQNLTTVKNLHHYHIMVQALKTKDLIDKFFNHMTDVWLKGDTIFIKDALAVATNDYHKAFMAFCTKDDGDLDKINALKNRSGTSFTTDYTAETLLCCVYYINLDGMDYNEGGGIYAVAVDPGGIGDDPMRGCRSMTGALAVIDRDGNIVNIYLHNIFHYEGHILRNVYFHLIQSGCSFIHVGDWGNRVSGGIMGRIIEDFEGMLNWIDNIIFASSELTVLMSSIFVTSTVELHQSNPFVGDDNDTKQHGINLPRIDIPHDRQVYQNGSHDIIPSSHGTDASPLIIAQLFFIVKKWGEDVVIIIIETDIITLSEGECLHEVSGYYASLYSQLFSDTMSTINPDPSWGASTRCLIKVFDTTSQRHRACIRWHNTLWGAYFAVTSTAGHFVLSSGIPHVPSHDVAHNISSSPVITAKFLHGMGCVTFNTTGTSRDDYSTVLIDVAGTTTFIVSHFLTSCMTRVHHNIERMDLFGGSLRSRAKHHRDTSNVSWGDIVRKERHHHDRRVIPDIVWGCSNRIRGDTRSAMNYFAVYYQDCSSLVVQTGIVNTSMIDFVYGESRLFRIEWIMYGILSCLMLIMHASPWNNGKSSVLYTQQHRCCMNTINYFTLLEGILKGSWLSSMAYSWEGRSKCMAVNRWGESIDDVLIYGHELYAENAIKCLSVWNDSLGNDTGIIPWHTTTCQSDGEIDVHGSIGSIAYKLRRLCKTRYQCSCIARFTSTETEHADTHKWDDIMTLITMSQIVSRDYSCLEFYRGMEECGDGDVNDIVVYCEAICNETVYRRTSNYTIADASPDYALSYDKLGGINGEPNSRISRYCASYRSSSESDVVGIENVSSYRFVRLLYILITNATNLVPKYGERSKIGIIGNSSLHVPWYTCDGQLDGGIDGGIDVNRRLSVEWATIKIALDAVYSFAIDYYHGWTCSGVIEDWYNQWPSFTMMRGKSVRHLCGCKLDAAKLLVFTSTLVCVLVHQVDIFQRLLHCHVSNASGYAIPTICRGDGSDEASLQLGRTIAIAVLILIWSYGEYGYRIMVSMIMGLWRTTEGWGDLLECKRRRRWSMIEDHNYVTNRRGVSNIAGCHIGTDSVFMYGTISMGTSSVCTGYLWRLLGGMPHAIV